MADEIIKEVLDLANEHDFHEEPTEHCSTCFAIEAMKCKECGGKGFIEKDEWVGTDTNYQVQVKCLCQED